MKFDTRYNTGDKVWIVINERKQETIPCDLCDGKGAVTIKGRDITCPDCRGRMTILSKAAKDDWQPKAC